MCNSSHGRLRRQGFPCTIIMVPTTHIKGAINKDSIRKMTPREWARLQGFPDDYKLELADTPLYKQFGNSVTVSVIEAIAKEIKQVLDIC